MSKVDQALTPAFLIYQEKLARAARESARHNIELLWETLEQMRREKKIDYSIAKVAERLEAAGGPREQSLRNKQGQSYRDIIIAYANCVGGEKRHVSKDLSPLGQLLASIDDLGVRAQLRIYFDEARKQKVANDNLRSAFKILQLSSTSSIPQPQQSTPGKDPVLTGSEILPAAPTLPTPGPQHRLSSRFRRALETGIADSRLAERGMNVAANGSIISVEGDILFPPGFILAIQEVLKW
jgi:hypothetical protein